jgi:hypothetical protein
MRQKLNRLITSAAWSPARVFGTALSGRPKWCIPQE